jgi:hypothetical protein
MIAKQQRRGIGIERLLGYDEASGPFVVRRYSALLFEDEKRRNTPDPFFSQLLQVPIESARS